jgi:hypothetical protein
MSTKFGKDADETSVLIVELLKNDQHQLSVSHIFVIKKFVAVTDLALLQYVGLRQHMPWHVTDGSLCSCRITCDYAYGQRCEVSRSH